MLPIHGLAYSSIYRMFPRTHVFNIKQTKQEFKKFYTQDDGNGLKAHRDKND